MTELSITQDNLGIPFIRNGAETSWKFNNNIYVISTDDARYLSMVGLGLIPFNPSRKVMGYKAA